MDAITEILTLSWILTPNATFICLRKHLHFKDSQNTVTTIRLWCSVVRPPQPLFTEKQSIKSTSWTWQHLKGRLSGIGTSCFTSSASCCALGFCGLLLGSLTQLCLQATSHWEEANFQILLMHNKILVDHQTRRQAGIICCCLDSPPNSSLLCQEGA